RLGGGVGVAAALGRFPGIAGAGAAQGEVAAGERGVGDQVVGRGAGDRDGDHVAGAGRVRLGEVFGQGQVHQAVVGGTAGDAVGGGVLAALVVGDEHIDLTPDLGRVLLLGDPVLQRNQAPVPGGDHL